MRITTRSRLLSWVARLFLGLAPVLFLFSMLSYPSFRRPEGGYLPFWQFVLAAGLVPILLFGLGMICRNKARKAEEPDRQQQVELDNS